jgi:chitin disaccharide deacetylase
VQSPANHERSIAACADDFGLHQGINEAALALARRGRITAISCMVGAPQWASGASALAKLPADDVDVGLHLDLTQYPLAAAQRRSLPALIALTGARLIDPARLRAQIDAQLDAFENGIGRAPAHVDGHQHVHQFPVVREVLVDALCARYPQRLPWLRRSRRPAALASGGFKPGLIERLGSDALSRLARAHGFAQNESLLGVYGFTGGAQRYAALLAQWLNTARQGDLLMAHPALTAGVADGIGAARCNEYQVLSSDAFAQSLEHARIRLAPLSRIRSGP